MAQTLAQPPTDLAAILEVEHALLFPSFTVDDAFEIGTRIRHDIFALFPSGPAAIIDIALANGPQSVFRCVTKSVAGRGVAPDNDHWVNMKRSAVLRWNASTWALKHKLANEKLLAEHKQGMLLGENPKYAFHGGGFPVRVKGVEGIVAVIVVSGLKQEEDHQVIVQAVQAYLTSKL